MITTSQLGYSLHRDAKSRKKFQRASNVEIKRRLFRLHFLEVQAGYWGAFVWWLGVYGYGS